jgi:rfaE bifunctional protein kinase chain/domain
VDAQSVTVADEVRLLAGRRVLVVGDLVLDRYWTGRPARISREAPVLVLELSDEEDRAGSAASPAANVAALGSHASVVGVLGCDPAGERVESSLRALEIDCDGLVRWPGAVTATKTRVLAEGFTGGLHGRQQVLRLDQPAQLADAAVASCADRVARLAPEADAVLLSDYRGGVVSAAAIAAARASGKPISVDSQGDLRRFRGVDLVKVNQAEAQAVLGHADLLGGGASLRAELGLKYLVITLGSEGMLVFGTGRPPAQVPAVRATEVFDVTGAGDTVIAVLTLAYVAGLPIRRAAEFASAAASLVVRRLGVATVSPDELIAALGSA